MAAGPELVLRQAGPDDGPAIRALLAETYDDNPKTDPAVMQWQYWDNPFGQALVWVWVEEGAVVSHSARLPVDGLMRGRPVRFGIGVDAATARTHRQRGLYEQLRRALHEACCREGVIATLLLLGDVSDVPRVDPAAGVPLRFFVYPLDPAWVAERFRIPRALVGSLLRMRRRPTAGGAEVPSPPEGLDDLWNRVGSRSPCSVAKGSVWWRWRYESHPTVRHRYFEVRSGTKLVGAAATTARRSGGGTFVYVLELLTDGDDAASALLRSIIDASEGASAVTFLAPPRSPSSLAARAAGLRPLRRLAGRHALGVWDTCADRPGFTEEPWSFTWGEADYL